MNDFQIQSRTWFHYQEFLTAWLAASFDEEMKRIWMDWEAGFRSREVRASNLLKAPCSGRANNGCN